METEDLSFFGDWYTDALAEYEKRSKLSETTVKLLAGLAEEYALDRCQSCISIGPGPGYIDVPLIKAAMPALKQFYGIEPRPDAIQTLKEWFAKDIGPRVQIDLIPARTENWSGPADDTKVDLVLVIQPLYHIDDKQHFFKQCLSWIRPGGLMIISHAVGTGIFTDLAKGLGVSDEQLYGAEDVNRDLRAVGITSWQEKSIPVTFDLRNRNQAIYNFLLQKSATMEEIQRADSIINEHLADGMEKVDSERLWVVKV